MRTLAALCILVFAVSARADTAAPPKAGACDKPNPTLLESLGAFGASQIYTEYSYLGVTADAYAKKAYDGKQVIALMTQHRDAIKILVSSLEKVRASGLDAGGIKAIDEMIAIYRMLDTEAAALATYAKSGGTKDLQAYDTARTSVYSRIKTLLGLKG